MPIRIVTLLAPELANLALARCVNNQPPLPTTTHKATATNMGRSEGVEEIDHGVVLL
jgi:hypothetical protein